MNFSHRNYLVEFTGIYQINYFVISAGHKQSVCWDNQHFFMEINLFRCQRILNILCQPESVR